MNGIDAALLSLWPPALGLIVQGSLVKPDPHTYTEGLGVWICSAETMSAVPIRLQNK